MRIHRSRSRGQAVTDRVSSGPNARELRRDEARERLAMFGLSLPAIVLVVAIIVIPVGWLFWLSLFNDEGALSLSNYTRMLDSKSYTRIFMTTFNVSVLTTGLCVLIAYPFSYFLSQLPKRWAAFGLFAVLLPFWTSLLVRTYAWLVVLQRKGLVNEWGIELGLWEQPLRLVHNLNGTLVGMVHIMLPFMVLPLYALHAGDQPRLHEGRVQSRREPDAGLLDGVLPPVAAGPVRRHGGGVRALPRVLRHPGGTGRRQGGDGVDEDRDTDRSLLQLSEPPARWGWC